MVYKIRILILSAFMVAKTFGDIVCEKPQHQNCQPPQIYEQIPTDVSEFSALCPEVKTFLKCLKDYQDSCENVNIYRSPDVFVAITATVSDLCEDGTSLNKVATENLACLSDILSNTNCSRESYDAIIAPHLEKPQTRNMESLRCLEQALTFGCLKVAVSEKCGQLAGEAMLDFFLRSKLLENYCSMGGEKSLLEEEMDNFNLKEDQKSSIAVFL